MKSKMVKCIRYGIVLCCLFVSRSPVAVLWKRCTLNKPPRLPDHSIQDVLRLCVNFVFEANIFFHFIVSMKSAHWQRKYGFVYKIYRRIDLCDSFPHKCSSTARLFIDIYSEQFQQNVWWMFREHSVCVCAFWSLALFHISYAQRIKMCKETPKINRFWLQYFTD